LIIYCSNCKNKDWIKRDGLPSLFFIDFDQINKGLRMKSIFLSTLGLFLITILICCTSSQQSQGEDKVYVFDEIPKENTITAPKTGEYPNLDQTYYVVQIGAFTTKERADTFAEMSKTKIKNEIDITYSDPIKLYVVQITPFYKSKKEAELVRDEIRLNPEFNDAWIVTINK
jgi:hypothetical protein